MSKRQSFYLLLVIFAGLVLVRFTAAALLPITEDEAYYNAWARHLSWGYFDHPPVVALLGQTTWLQEGSSFFARLGTLLASLLVFPITLALFRRCGLSERWQLPYAAVLTSFSLGGLVFGFLTTPDVVLTLAWALALNEASAALVENPRRWLTAGLAVGVGFLSKYVMVLIGPVFLWALLRSKPSQLRSPWPYAGALAALLMCLPHLAWNAQHDWITVKFQLGRGFLHSHAVSTSAVADLPAPQVAPPGSREDQFYKMFIDPLAEKVPKPERSAPLRALIRVGEFLASQFLLWGFFALPIIVMLGSVARRRQRTTLLEIPQPALQPLMAAAALVPLGVFGSIAIFAKVEAHWAAVYMLAAPVFLVGFFQGRGRLLAGLTLLNVLLIGGALIHERHADTTTRGNPRRDRLLRETHGYRQMAAHLATLPLPVLTENYQLNAMVNFYEPKIAAAQWPGLARKSEFVWRPQWQTILKADLDRSGGFYLLTNNGLPPRLPGFTPTAMTEIADCLELGLMLTPADPSGYKHPCRRRAVHQWYLIEYRPPSS